MDERARPVLVVERQVFEIDLDRQIGRGKRLQQIPIDSQRDLSDWYARYRVWVDYTEELLIASFSDPALATEFKNASGPLVMGISLRDEVRNAVEQCTARVTKLESIRKRLPFFIATTGPEPRPQDRDAIFVVHGHDEKAKNEVARFLEKLTSLRVDILHELPSAGMTLIEKLERYANRSLFAVVILTADDVGAARRGDAHADGLRPRARQNVVLELGYFLAAIGRARVVALYEEGIELPSDMAGLVYVLLDQRGAWRTEVLRELMAAGVDVNPGRAFGGTSG